MQMANTLYPDWTGPQVALPNWVFRYGLTRWRPLIQRIYAASPHWQQADADGLTNIAPVLVKFNKSPKEIKAEIGGEAWKSVHHASLKTNVDRLVLCMVGGWSFEEAMQFPAKERKRAKTFLGRSKTAVLHACRLAGETGDIFAQLTIAEDVQRMGGTLDLTWGRKRLKREHDALVMKRIMQSADPTPWAEPWFHDEGDYSFSLLKSAAELAIEGATQRHCVSSYARSCRDGKDVVLRIDGAERATCSWRRGESYMQVKGFANTSVSMACLSAAIAARKAFNAHMAKKKG